jgi:hypothetical protein
MNHAEIGGTMDDEIKKRFAELEAKIAALEAEDKNILDGLNYHVDRHYDLHRDLERMVYLSFFKTHPEFGNSMDQFHDIFDGKSKPTDEGKR